MTLGENIARLRAEKNLSQGALAEALNVSRQSVSKWETDGSVPELERLMQMSELFGVSLDELVKGEAAESAEPPAPEPLPVQTVVVQQRPLSGRQIAGIALLGVNLFTTVLFLALGIAIGLLISVPLAVCGLVCLLAKRRVILKSFWAAYLCVDLFLRFAVGTNWSVALGFVHMFFRDREWAMQSMRAQALIAAGQLAGMLLLNFFTARGFRKEAYEPTKKRKALLIAGWVVYALRWIVPCTPPFLWLQERFFAGFTFAGDGPMFLYRVCDAVMGYAFLALLIWLIVTTLGVLRWKKTQKNDG